MKWPPSNRRSRASGRSRRQVKVRPALRTNSPEGVLGFLRGGGGISTLPRYIVSEDLRSGRLKQLLPQWRLPGGGIYLTWPGGRDAPAKVRAFVDFLRERARRDPRWLDLD
jgi:DNA-binding transcriptional LysR family regulator